MGFRLDVLNLSESEKVKREKEDIERSHFVQELLLSMLASDYSHLSSSNTDQRRDEGFDRATLALCPRLSTLPSENTEPTSSLNTDILSSASTKSSSISKSGKKPLRQKTPNLLKNTSNFESTSQNTRTADSDAETTLVLQPPTGISARNLYSSDHESYDSGEDDEKDSDVDDRPPSPRQRIGMRLQNRLHSPVGLAAAPLSHYGREDVSTADSIGKHIH